MDEKALKMLAYMTAIGIAVAAIITAIDLKIKDDLVKLALKTDNDLKLMQAFAGTMVPMEARNEQAPNGTSEMGAWPVRSVPDNLHAMPVFRTDARMEARDSNSQSSHSETESEPIVSGSGNADSGIQESN